MIPQGTENSTSWSYISVWPLYRPLDFKTCNGSALPAHPTKIQEYRSNANLILSFAGSNSIGMKSVHLQIPTRIHVV